MGERLKSIQDTAGEINGEETTSEELLWIVSMSLLTASQSCNDVATQSSLFQYQHTSTEREHNAFGDRNLGNIQQSLEAAKEDINLALDAIKELDRRTE